MPALLTQMYFLSYQVIAGFGYNLNMAFSINNSRRFSITIDGIVQGVGFRPFVYNYAVQKKYKGSIRNTSTGVAIELESPDDPYDFINYLQNNCPPLARIYSIDIQELSLKGLSDFSIVESADEEGFTHVSPDIAVCSDCLSELLNPADRRYLYPFINCTNCGPRYTIVKKVPYDRPNTTMSEFTMCNVCMTEYQNPLNRRFHAQPNACHKCGPKLSLLINSSELNASNEDILKTSIKILQQGGILAIKGIGGFHLVCDANNQVAVSNLRERKRRLNKPFALMSLDVETIGQYCEISQTEAALLNDRRRPIVLLAKKNQSKLPFEIAPNNGYFGFMLPYAPLHYLLFVYHETPHEQNKNFQALIMTSGNISEEPIAASNEEALSRLSDIADAFLIHDRDIFTRIDDSVAKIHNYRPIFIRRARGYVPESIIFTSIQEKFNDTIAVGADLKNTFTIMKGNKAIVSQYTGDLENIQTIDFFMEIIDKLKSVYKASPSAIAYDMHPGYHSSKLALGYAERYGIKSFAIQHHHAHIASVMAEHDLNETVIGISFDGTGYGTDGNLWGGEFLICHPGWFERFAHFKYIPLPGGEMAIRECWRTAISFVRDAANGSILDKERFLDLLDSIGFTQKYSAPKIENILKIIDDRRFSPLSSGAGRLFDAVSALTGICDINTFEGESAAALENLLFGQKGTAKESYQFLINNRNPYIVDFSPMIKDILKDIMNAIPVETVSFRFHNTIIRAINVVADIIRCETGVNIIALSGGVFQNRYIAEGAFQVLSQNRFDVYFNEKVPCNDGGISLGQAYVLNYILKGD